MREDHLQAWLAEATREDRSDTKKRYKVVNIIQYAFREGQIIMDCACKTAVFISKGNGKFHEIGLMEVIWKAVLVVTNC